MFDNVPDAMPVWRVELDPEVADAYRREVGSDQRAALEEQGWASEHGSLLPPRARLLRVEPDAPVGVFVEASWPVPDVGYRHEDIRRILRSLEPVEPPAGYEGPALLEHVLWFAVEEGFYEALVWGRAGPPSSVDGADGA